MTHQGLDLIHNRYHVGGPEHFTEWGGSLFFGVHYMFLVKAWVAYFFRSVNGGFLGVGPVINPRRVCES